MTYEENEFVKEKLQKEDYAVRILEGQTLLNVSKNKIHKGKIERLAKEIFNDKRFSYNAEEYTISYGLELPAIMDLSLVNPRSIRLRAIIAWNSYNEGKIGASSFFYLLEDKRYFELVKNLKNCFV